LKNTYDFKILKKEGGGRKKKLIWAVVKEEL